MSETNKPLWTRRAGDIAASLWERTHKETVFYNVSLVRNYKNDKGKWSHTSSFAPADLPVVAALAEAAFRHVLSLQAAVAEPESKPEATDDTDAA